MNFPTKLLLLSLTVAATLVSSLWAGDVKTKFVSPNGKYAVRMGTDDSGAKTFTLVSVKTGAVLAELDSLGISWSKDFRLIWAPDSQRAASFSPDRRGGWTHLFVRDGASFSEIDLPEVPELTFARREGSKTVTSARIPVRWTKANVLLIDHQAEDEDGASAKQRVSLTFNAKNEIKVAPVQH